MEAILSLGGMRKLATALKEVEEAREEMQEKRDEREVEEIEENGRLKVDEIRSSCMDGMTCTTPLSHAMQNES